MTRDQDDDLLSAVERAAEMASLTNSTDSGLEAMAAEFHRHFPDRTPNDILHLMESTWIRRGLPWRRLH